MRPQGPLVAFTHWVPPSKYHQRSKLEKHQIWYVNEEVLPPVTHINPYLGKGHEKWAIFFYSNLFFYLSETSFLDLIWFLGVLWAQISAKGWGCHRDTYCIEGVKIQSFPKSIEFSLSNTLLGNIFTRTHTLQPGHQNINITGSMYEKIIFGTTKWSGIF